MNTAHPHWSRRSAAVMLTGVIGVAAVGYLVGINDGVPQENYDLTTADSRNILAIDAAVATSSPLVGPAVKYSEMRRMETGPTSQWKPSLEHFLTDDNFQRCITCHDPHSSQVRPNQEDKLRSLSIRATRRAYNGAPPVVPHAVERTDAAACYACHGQGTRVGNRVANRMPHAYLVHCLQCHAAPTPKPFTHFVVEPANIFEGLPTPTFGDRAFPSAPPVIPHSTWMRKRCLSCHQGVAGWPGLEVPHRWRRNCKQCHATSAKLEQAIVSDTLEFESVFARQIP